MKIPRHANRNQLTPSHNIQVYTCSLQYTMVLHVGRGRVEVWGDLVEDGDWYLAFMALGCYKLRAQCLGCCAEGSSGLRLRFRVQTLGSGF